VRAGEPDKLTARVNEKAITVSAAAESARNDVGDAAGDSGQSEMQRIVAAVHQLLHDAGILISSERLGL
jgi:hypothetical protein